MRPSDRKRRSEPGEHLRETTVPEAPTEVLEEPAQEPVQESVQAPASEGDAAPSWDRPSQERAARVAARESAWPLPASESAPATAALGPAIEEITEVAHERRGRLLVVATFLAALAALAAVGLLGYVLYLRSECIRLETAKSEAFRERDELRADLGKLTLAAAGMREPGVVHGRVILRDERGRRRAMPGVVVRLYERSVIEEHLAERADTMPPPGTGTGSSFASHFAANLPAPLSSATTGSSGNFELIAPGPGNYVLQAGTIEKSSRMLRFWLLSVDTADPINTAIEISPEKEVKVFDPLLMIREAR